MEDMEISMEDMEGLTVHRVILIKPLHKPVAFKQELVCGRQTP